MKAIILLISLYTHPNALRVIDTVPPQNIKYQVKLVNQDAETKNGYLVDVDDSTISLARAPLPKSDTLLRNFIRYKYAYPTITSIEINRQGVLGKSMLWGAGIGLAAGAIGGLISGDDPKEPETGEPFPDIFIAINNAFTMTAGQKALVYGSLFATLGVGIGALVGLLSKKKFRIKGKKEPFDAMRNAILHPTMNTNNTPAN